MEYAIETTALTKVFFQSKNFFPYFSRKKNSIFAVNDVSLQIKKGELFGIAGPNGAGKTTLIKLLCCLVLPSKGTARVMGYDVYKDELKIKSLIGLVTGDERSFYGRLTGRQNLIFYATLYGLFLKQIKDKIANLSHILEIEDYMDIRFQMLSAGIKQRFAIVRSLLNNASVLFMDEPTKNLDPISSQKLRGFIKKILVEEEKKTVFFSSHNLNELEILSDRIAIMDKGRIKACGSFSELKGALLDFKVSNEELLNYYINQVH